ncbi:MAG: OmpA family protein [Rhodocyclaceae bacterium]|nr:OmpA family protein [Rhodocyclaceae bacterium]
MISRCIALTLVAAVSAGASTAALAQDKSGYWVNTEGTVWRSGYNLCWRAGYWTPALAIAECDPDLVADSAKSGDAPAPHAAAPEAPTEASSAAAQPIGPQKAAFEKFTFGAETLFAFDKADIRPDAADVLQNVVEKMNRYPEVEVIAVTGHTDRIGSDDYNQKLSERRASAVRSFLVDKGVQGGRIRAAGRGEAEPVVGCGTIKGKENRANKSLIQCLQPNRRVVVEIAVQRETGAY